MALAEATCVTQTDPAAASTRSGGHVPCRLEPDALKPDGAATAPMQHSAGQLDGVDASSSRWHVDLLDVGQFDSPAEGVLPVQREWPDLLDTGQFGASAAPRLDASRAVASQPNAGKLGDLARVEGAVVPESEIPEQKKLAQADIDRILAGMKSTGHLQIQVSEAPSSSSDMIDSQSTRWLRDCSHGSNLEAEFSSDRQTTFGSLSFGGHTSSSSEMRTPAAPQADSGAAQQTWESLQLPPASEGDEATTLLYQEASNSTASVCAAPVAPPLPLQEVPTRALLARQQSTASSASADSADNEPGRLFSAPDVVRRLWMTDGGPSKHNATWWPEHFAPDCEYEDLRHQESYRGRAAVQALLPSLVLPPGTRRVVTNISGGVSSCGFTWHLEEDGAGILQRGVTFLRVDRRGKVTYLREGCEPPPQVSVSPAVERCASPNLAVRQAALQEVKCFASSGAVVLPRILACIDQAKDDPMRLEGLVPALVEVAEKGDAVVVSTLISNLRHNICWVRVHCLVGLGKLATVDDTVAMDSVVPFTQDSSWQVREASTEALGSIAGPAGGAVALRALQPLLQDSSVRVSAAALAAHDRVLARQAPAASRWFGPAWRSPSRRQRPRAAQEAMAACGGAIATVMIALLMERLLKRPAR